MKASYLQSRQRVRRRALQLRRRGRRHGAKKRKRGAAKIEAHIVDQRLKISKKKNLIASAVGKASLNAREKSALERWRSEFGAL
jgi:hypothetical protein